MKIAVVGPGALGCFVAGRLSKFAEVWLLDKNPKRVKSILEKGGITCQGVSGKWQARLPVTVRAADIGPAELIIICTKAYDTPKAASHIKESCAEGTIVLSLQNGLGNIEVLTEIFGQENVLAGVTHHGLTLVDEGSVAHTGAGQTVIGHLGGRIPAQVRQVREVFNKAGIETKVSRDIKSVLWSKLVINAGINALSAVTRLKNGRLAEYEGASSIMQAAVTEAVKVAKKKRIKLIYDDPLAKIEAVCEATSSNRSSMLQDVLKNKRTEIDYINGFIVRQGQSTGIATPVNFTLLNLVRTIEASYPVSQAE